MIPAHFLSEFLSFNILVLASGLFSAFLHLINRRFHFVKWRSELQFNYGLFLFVVLISATQLFIPDKEVFNAPVKVWSATSSANFSREFSDKGQSGYVKLEFARRNPAFALGPLSVYFRFLGLIFVGYFLFQLIRDLQIIMKLRRQSFPTRKFRTVHIYASDHIAVPFSFWIPFHHLIIFPTSLLERRGDLNIALIHELQHHRQKDCRWVHLFRLSRIICFLNPGIYLWTHLISEIQEFACDEALVDRRKVSPEAYAGCLLRVAETAVTHGSIPVSATGFVLTKNRHSLTRRIEFMFMENKKKLGRRFSLFATFFIMVGMTALSSASQGLIQDRRVTQKKAEEMLANVKNSDGFQVVINDLVLRQLNRYIGTPEGRDFMRKSLRRMDAYKSMIEKKLMEYGVPQELIAIPIIESGYQNLEPGGSSQGAGLWMFIPSTARNFDLQVDDKKDERLNEELLSDAAMRYLLANKLRFKSWELSVYAYNLGESSVQKAMDKTGSRDVWTLVRAGYENDKDYMPKIMAAILIENNPGSLE